MTNARQVAAFQVGTKQKTSSQHVEEDRSKHKSMSSRSQYQQKARRYAAPTLKKIQSGVAWHKVHSSGPPAIYKLCVSPPSVKCTLDSCYELLMAAEQF